MKIETTTLKAKILLTILKDPALGLRKFAIRHYGPDDVDELIAALEDAAKEKPESLPDRLTWQSRGILR